MPDWLSIHEPVLVNTIGHSAGVVIFGLLLVTVGFVILTVISVVLELRQENRAAGSRLARAMGLLLFAISFVHFGAEHTRLAWSKEIALHHAGLPLALLVLLQDYRFLLLDAFLRFIVNASLAAGALLLAIRAVESRELAKQIQHPFQAGLLFVSACLLLTLFVYIRNTIQSFLTRVTFLRSNIAEALAELQQLARAAHSEVEYLRHAGEVISRFLRASRFDMTQEQPLVVGTLTVPVAVVDAANWTVPSWGQAVLPMAFSQGDPSYLLLGPRHGGRRYLSEDFDVLVRFRAAVIEQVEQLRSVQMQSLVSQAELKTLQAQINPHFLFNSLYPLYGTIDRSNAEARRLVLNLSDIFRYLLHSERTFIEIEEELRIVRAYLEIEELRLGPKLRTEIEIDQAAVHASIPVLSIQPLVENALKHACASKMGTAFVRLTIKSHADGISVEVSNSGECEVQTLTNPARGIGLTNVRRRLALCYGEQTRFEASVANGVTSVGFTLPLAASPQVSFAVERE